MVSAYSRNAVARTPMTRLPRLFQTVLLFFRIIPIIKGDFLGGGGFVCFFCIENGVLCVLIRIASIYIIS